MYDISTCHLGSEAAIYGAILRVTQAMNTHLYDRTVRHGRPLTIASQRQINAVSSCTNHKVRHSHLSRRQTFFAVGGTTLA